MSVDDGLSPPRMMYETKKGQMQVKDKEWLFARWRSEGKMRCCRCRHVKVKSEFLDRMYFHADYPYCKLCRRKVARASGRKADLKNKYGMCFNEYTKILEGQKGKCAICKKNETHINHVTKEILNLTVDHCHLTGVIRGLLCRNCNLMLGNSKDSSKTLRSAIKYLSSPLPKLLEEAKNVD